MKLIWHIIKKDFAHDRWSILVWALFFVAQIVLGFVFLREPGMSKSLAENVQMANGVLICLQVVAAYVLVARLVQADAVIGSQLFWVTRPISRGRLLAAKALGALLIFGLLPVALLLPWWLYNGFGARDLWWAAVETFGWQLLVIAPAFLVASLTDDLGRVLLWSLLLVVVLAGWMTLLQGVNVPIIETREGRVGLMFTRVWVICLLAVAGAAAVAAHHYLTRRLARSAVLACLGMGFIVLTGYLWTWNWSKAIVAISQPAPPPPPAGLVEGLTLEPAYGRARPNMRRNEREESYLNVILHVSGLPDGLSLYTDDVVHTWRWPNSPVFKRSNEMGYARFLAEKIVRQAYNLPVPVRDPETVRWYEALREKDKARREKEKADRAARGAPDYSFAPFAVRSRDRLVMWSYAPLPDAVIAKMRREPAAYTGRFEGMITRGVIAAEIPLLTGARASGDSQTLRMSRLQSGLPGPLWADLATTMPSTRKSGLWQFGINPPTLDRLFGAQFMDVNHTTGDLSRVSETQVGEALIGGVNMTWRHATIHPFTVIREGKEVPKDPQWVEHTTLVMLGEKAVARFRREVHTDQLEVEPLESGN